MTTDTPAFRVDEVLQVSAEGAATMAIAKTSIASKRESGGLAGSTRPSGSGAGVLPNLISGLDLQARGRGLTACPLVLLNDELGEEEYP